MKKVGIVICNYNKKMYVDKCIESIKNQTINDYTIYMVDNNSTDGSIDYIRNKYGDFVNIIANKENLGGSGGFNTGIKKAINHKYIVLLDNDVILESKCIERCLDIIENDKTIGMVGCEILKMDMPDIIQEYGPTIDYENMNFVLNYGGEKDNVCLPDIIDCDYVPACAMMTTKEVINKIGYMPSENFIYYDDITWCVKCHRAGYRVVATKLAKAWHKGGAAINTSTFPTYYLTRNKTKFFIEYMSTEKIRFSNEDIEIYAEKILLEVFEGIYSCYKKNMLNVAKTRMEAFIDALIKVEGKSEEYKIRDRENIKEKFSVIFEMNSIIKIYMNGLWESTRRILYKVNEIIKNSKKQYSIYVIDNKYSGNEILGYKIYHCNQVDNKKADIELNVCKHIYEEDINDLSKCWIDGWRNTIIDEEDMKSVKEFKQSYKLFKLEFKDMLINRIQENNLI